MPVPVLDHYDRSVDQNAYGQRQPAQRHDVGTDLQIIHRDERRDDRDWQRENRNQRRTQMKEKNDNHETDNHGLFDEIAFQRIDRRLDKFRPVIAGDNFDAPRQSLANLSEPLLHTIDDSDGILPITHDNDAADRLPVAIPLGRSFAKIGSQA